MKNKKGFTLIEILAVITLISMIMMIAIPNVMSTFNKGKKLEFKDEVLILYKNAITTYISRTDMGEANKTFCSLEGSKQNLIDVKNKSELLYNIKMDEFGNVIELNISNESYGISLKNPNGIKKKDITLEEITDKIDINCN